VERLRVRNAAAVSLVSVQEEV